MNMIDKVVVMYGVSWTMGSEGSEAAWEGTHEYITNAKEYGLDFHVAGDEVSGTKLMIGSLVFEQNEFDSAGAESTPRSDLVSMMEETDRKLKEAGIERNASLFCRTFMG